MAFRRSIHILLKLKNIGRVLRPKAMHAFFHLEKCSFQLGRFGTITIKTKPRCWSTFPILSKAGSEDGANTFS